MCGIVGAIAGRDVTPILIEGLKRLEYRGYDSAGVAIVDDKKQIQRRRIQGKVHELCHLIEKQPLKGKSGIAHTRWATHGIPSDFNAHPHMSNNEFAVVHNGIIENYEVLQEGLKTKGYEFISQTDTEVIAHQLHFNYQQEKDFLKALQKTVQQIKGAYALGIIHQQQPNRLLAVRCGSPLVLGLGIKENFIASDSLALLPVTNRFIYLEEGDIADVNRDKVEIYNSNGDVIQRSVYTLKVNDDVTDKGIYRHYMQKEIFEQPQALAATLEGRISNSHILVETFGPKAKEIFAKVKHVTIVACGTSYHAALIAKYWVEDLAGISCCVEIASEYRYRKVVVNPNSLFITISQSGETADTLAALRLAKDQHYLASLCICNVPMSSLTRESDFVFLTRAGREIGVASTKAFTTQLTSLLLFALTLAKQHGLDEKKESEIVTALNRLPRLVEKSLESDKLVQILAKSFADKQHALFLGRGSQYPVALEGALKLKEISYIHAEAYPAGELKHGPLALVDKQMPVIAVAPNDHLLEKLKSNLHEVQARGGHLIVFADKHAKMTASNGEEVIHMPETNQYIAPIIYTIPLQLLAYYVAVIKGTDVDQPRNLAKSVTVE